MPPGTYALALYEGDTAHWQFKLWTDSAKKVADNLAGATARSEIRDKPNGTVLGELICVITQPNIIDVTFPLALWGSWPADAFKGVWDLEITYPNQIVTTVLAGGVQITPDVTQ